MNDIFDVLCCFLFEIEICLQTLLIGWDLCLSFFPQNEKYEILLPEYEFFGRHWRCLLKTLNFSNAQIKILKIKISDKFGTEMYQIYWIYQQMFGILTHLKVMATPRGRQNVLLAGHQASCSSDSTLYTQCVSLSSD